ncbi:class F sortase [Streptomyces fradiae]|uniref:class F sortase n=1 Tax=Streptomyces fradiae TaxID=1906 RepID=UPI0033CAE495
MGLDTAVVPIGVADDGGLDVPSDSTTAGWWRDTAEPGSSQGSTVIAGHLDSRQGPAVFAPLTRSKPGDQITVSTSAGPVSYRVTAVIVRRGAALPAEYISTTGPHRLVLVTCTGPYQQAGGYRDRLYLDAAPAGPANR